MNEYLDFNGMRDALFRRYIGVEVIKDDVGRQILRWTKGNFTRTVLELPIGGEPDLLRTKYNREWLLDEIRKFEEHVRSQEDRLSVPCTYRDYTNARIENLFRWFECHGIQLSLSENLNDYSTVVTLTRGKVRFTRKYQGYELYEPSTQNRLLAEFENFCGKNIMEEFEKMPKIIAVDFDGCLVENRFPEIGKPLLDNIERLKKEQENGARVILWTCRRGQCCDDAVKFCKDVGIRLDAINENLPDIVKDFGGDTRKIFAHEYWDDRAVLIDKKSSGVV